MGSTSGPGTWAVSWSGGKDSALALDRAVRAGLDVRYLVTLYDPATGRVRFHGTRRPVLEAQARALGRELLALPAAWDSFEAVFLEGLRTLVARGVEGLIFGNIHLADVRGWYEERVVAAGLRHHEPLWHEASHVILEELLVRGYVAHLVSVELARVPRSWLGRVLDASCCAEIQTLADMDPSGERGEYHTLVTAGSLFMQPVPVRAGRVHEEAGFLLLDVDLDEWE